MRWSVDVNHELSEQSVWPLLVFRAKFGARISWRLNQDFSVGSSPKWQLSGENWSLCLHHSPRRWIPVSLSMITHSSPVKIGNYRTLMVGSYKNLTPPCIFKGGFLDFPYYLGLFIRITSALCKNGYNSSGSYWIWAEMGSKWPHSLLLSDDIPLLPNGSDQHVICPTVSTEKSWNNDGECRHGNLN